MNIPEREQLTREYIQRFQSIVYWPLKFTGFCRFDIKNNRIIERSLKTVVYNVAIIMLSNLSAFYILTTSAENNLKLPEIITISHFVLFANFLLINSTFANRGSGSELMNICIEIDIFLGLEETRFMRDVAMKYLAIMCCLVRLVQLFVVGYMYYVFLSVSIVTHIIGSAYFGWLFCAYDDYSFFLSLYSFLSLRVRYLNVAIMKISNMNSEYVPKQLLFNGLFWKNKFDSLVTFHNRAGPKDFARAFIMLFDQLEQIQRSYRFAIILGVWTIVMGTFVSVQAFITYVKSSNLDTVRASVVTGWAVGSWLYILLICQQAERFPQQLEQTKLICAFIQLKPTNSAEIFKLTKGILRTLEVREARASIYGLFYFDTGLVFRIAASTFVYITVQLQMAFPREDINASAKTLPAHDCMDIPPYKCSS